MARAQEDSGSLRFSRRERRRLLAALAVSLLVHVTIWAVYHFGNKFNVWQKLHAPAWLQPVAKKQPPKQEALPLVEDPMTFVDVSHADADAPVKPKYYSYRNSHAANPVENNLKVPHIDGKQTVVTKTEDARKATRKDESTPKSEPPQTVVQPHPLMPSPKPAEALSPQAHGETELLKTNTDISTNPSKSAQPQQQRPRTIREALAQQNQLPGEKMLQAGGVSRHAQFTALDAKATSFGEYDRALIDAVTEHWYGLLDSKQYADDRTGRVTVSFKLRSDGSVIEVRIAENTVGPTLGMLCVDSIEESAPFAKWPSDMLREIGANYRDVTFTFYYY